MDNRLQWAIARMLDIVSGNFYGSVTLFFGAGKLLRLEHQSSEKPPEDMAM